MMNSFAENFEEIKNLVRKKNIDKIYGKLININLNLLKKYIDILKSFNDATLLLSSNESPTIQQVIPLKFGLKRVCESNQDDEKEIKLFKFSLLQNLEVYMQVKNIHKIALLLDPKKEV